MQEVRLTTIKYFIGIGLFGVTFVFSDNTQSPPLRSYEIKPSEETEVPKDLQTITFGICQYGKQFYLVKIGMVDRQTDDITEIECGYKQTR